MERFQKEMYFQMLNLKGKTDYEIQKILDNNQFICPNCLEIYIPTYKTKQKAFETNDMEAREQWLSHICSTECWNQYLGVKIK